MAIIILVALSLLTIAQVPRKNGGRKAIFLAIAFAHLLTIMADPLLSQVGTLLRIPVWILGILYALSLSPPLKNESSNSTLYRIYRLFLILFVLWGAASLLWSVNRIDTLVKVVNFSLIIAFLHLNLTRCWKENIRVAMNDLRVMTNACLLLIVLSTAFTLPALQEALAGTARYQGLFQNPNTLAALAAVSFFLSVQFYTIERRGPLRLMPLLLIAALLLSGSRSSTVAVLVAGALTLLVYTLRNITYLQRIVPAALVGCFMLSILYLTWRILSSRTTIESTVSLPRQFDLDVSDTLFNSRELLWQTGVQLFQEKPLIGIGFNGTRTALDRLYNMGLYGGEPRQLHNSYLEILVDLGLIGALIFFFVMLFLAIRFVQSIKVAPLLSAAFVVPLVLSMTESAIFGLSSIVATLFWTLATILFTTDEKGKQITRDRELSPSTTQI